MEKENITKTREDLVKFITEKEFVLGDYWFFDTNVRVLADAVQFMQRDWYIEWMWTADFEEWYQVADYYDDIVHDVIVFDTEVHWNYFDTAEQVADYLYDLNAKYEYTKTKYEEMYTIAEAFKKIFRLLITN